MSLENWVLLMALLELKLLASPAAFGAFGRRTKLSQYLPPNIVCY